MTALVRTSCVAQGHYNELSAWTAQAGGQSAPLSAAPRGATTAWWRGVREGRTAAMVEQSIDDALAGLRHLPIRARQRRAGFKAGVIAQAEIEEAELDHESSYAAAPA